MAGGGGPPPMGPMGGMGGPPPNGFPHDQYGGPPAGGMMRSRSRSFSPPTRGRHHKRRRSPSRSACAELWPSHLSALLHAHCKSHWIMLV